MKILGFINHNTVGFSNTYALNILYTSLVGSALNTLLLFGLPVECLTSIVQIKYKNKFSKINILVFRCEADFFDFKSQTKRRVESDVTFINKHCHLKYRISNVSLILKNPSQIMSHQIMIRSCLVDCACRTVNNLLNIALFYGSLLWIIRKLYV